MNSAFKPEQPRRYWHLLALLLLLLGLTGCQALTERLYELQDYEAPSQNGDTREANQALLNELQQLGAQTEEQRRQRYDALRPQLQSASCGMDTLRISMLYLSLNSPPQDDLTPLTGAMNTCMETDAAPTFKGMAQFLQSSLVQHSEDSNRIRELEQIVNHEQTRNAALTDQLEALKAIERSLRDRGQNSTDTRED